MMNKFFKIGLMNKKLVKIFVWVLTSVNDLMIPTPEATSFARATAFNLHNVGICFHN